MENAGFYSDDTVKRLARELAHVDQGAGILEQFARVQRKPTTLRVMLGSPESWLAYGLDMKVLENGLYASPGFKALGRRMQVEFKEHLSSCTNLAPCL